MSTPAATAMRRLRAHRREALQAPSRMEAGRYLYRTTRMAYGVEAQQWIRETWEGRVQIDGKQHVVARSVAKFGERSAYLQCLNHVGAWLLTQHPADQVAAKVLALMEAAPAGGTR